jgi:hypothetical protein
LLIIDITKDTILAAQRQMGSREQLKAAVLNRERPFPNRPFSKNGNFHLTLTLGISYTSGTHVLRCRSLEPRLELSGRKKMAAQKLSAVTLAFTAEGALQAMDSGSGSSYECRMFD